MVYGDYDADGVTSTVLLYAYLREQGADVLYMLPERGGRVTACINPRWIRSPRRA